MKHRERVAKRHVHRVEEWFAKLSVRVKGSGTVRRAGGQPLPNPEMSRRKSHMEWGEVAAFYGACEEVGDELAKTEESAGSEVAGAPAMEGASEEEAGGASLIR